MIVLQSLLRRTSIVILRIPFLNGVIALSRVRFLDARGGVVCVWVGFFSIFSNKLIRNIPRSAVGVVGLCVNLPKLIFLDIEKGVGSHVVGAVRVGVVRVENLEVG